MKELIHSVLSSEILTISASILSLVVASISHLIVPLLRRKHKSPARIKLENDVIELHSGVEVAVLEDQLQQLIFEKEQLEHERDYLITKLEYTEQLAAQKLNNVYAAQEKSASIDSSSSDSNS